jgi:hypothetical protein
MQKEGHLGGQKGAFYTRRPTQYQWHGVISRVGIGLSVSVSVSIASARVRCIWLLHFLLKTLRLLLAHWSTQTSFRVEYVE